MVEDRSSEEKHFSEGRKAVRGIYGENISRTDISSEVSGQEMIS